MEIVITREIVIHAQVECKSCSSRELSVTVGEILQK